MKTILSLFVVLLFVAGCGGSDSGIMEMVEEVVEEMPKPDSTEPATSPDFMEIEIPSTFMLEDGLLSSSELNDAHLVPDEMVEFFKNALTIEVSRNELIRRTREASFCNALDDVSDEEIWGEMVYQFNLDELETWGNNLEEAIRNVLAYDLPLDRVGSPDGSEFYGDTLEEEEAWSILADEVDGLDALPGKCI